MVHILGLVAHILEAVEGKLLGHLDTVLDIDFVDKGVGRKIELVLLVLMKPQVACKTVEILRIHHHHLEKVNLLGVLEKHYQLPIDEGAVEYFECFDLHRPLKPSTPSFYVILVDTDDIP